jgi:hypothetical protein
MDEVIQIEIVLNFLNTLFAKAVYFNDEPIRKELADFRHEIYYEKRFNYESSIEKLQAISKELEARYPDSKKQI